MRKIALCAILFTALFTATATASQWKDSVGNPNSRVFSGKVSDIDAGESTIAVDGGLIRTFTVLSDARIKKGTNYIKLSDVSVGDYVNIEYTEEAGELKAFFLTVMYGTSKD